MRLAAKRLLPARVALLLTLALAIAGSSAAIGTSGPDGLVAAYSFDGGAGSTLADESGSGNHGAISGATWSTAGKTKGSLSFDGFNDKVTIADHASLDLTTGMTLEAWVRPTALGGFRTVIAKERSGGIVYALHASQDSLGRSGRWTSTESRTPSVPPHCR